MALPKAIAGESGRTRSYPNSQTDFSFLLSAACECLRLLLRIKWAEFFSSVRRFDQREKVTFVALLRCGSIEIIVNTRTRRK